MYLSWDRTLRKQHDERYISIPKEVADCWQGVRVVRIQLKKDHLIITPVFSCVQQTDNLHYGRECRAGLSVLDQERR
jgi:hypothetical protein